MNFRDLHGPGELLVDYLETPIGTLALVVELDGRLRGCGFTTDHGRMVEELRLEAPRLKRTANPGGVTSALRAYFAGEVSAIEDVPVSVQGTQFQRMVWSALRHIPSGSTWSYGELASRIGRPKAVRAVGLANGANPVGLVLPCHRVIGASGKLTGYGGGLDRKRWLLDHERRAQRSIG